MNKETYERIKLDVTVFEQDDVITTSPVIRGKYEGNLIISDEDSVSLPIGS